MRATLRSLALASVVVAGGLFGLGTSSAHAQGFGAYPGAYGGGYPGAGFNTGMTGFGYNRGYVNPPVVYGNNLGYGGFNTGYNRGYVGGLNHPHHHRHHRGCGHRF